MSKEEYKGVSVAGVHYHPSHTATKDVFQKMFGKNPQWEQLWEKVKKAKEDAKKK